MLSNITQLDASQKRLAVLIDPEKENNFDTLLIKCKLIEKHKVDYIFIGASSHTEANSELISKFISENCSVPLIGFPGNSLQINSYWDGILFLNLISSSSAKYLFLEQLQGVNHLSKNNISLNIYPTGYLLLDGKTESNTAKTSESKAIPQENTREILNRCLTATYLGQNHLYLEAGSGAKQTVCTQLVSQLKDVSNAFIIAGGGIKNTQQAKELWQVGTNLIVVGNLFESQPEDIQLFANCRDQLNITTDL